MCNYAWRCKKGGDLLMMDWQSVCTDYSPFHRRIYPKDASSPPAHRSQGKSVASLGQIRKHSLICGSRGRVLRLSLIETSKLLYLKMKPQLMVYLMHYNIETASKQYHFIPLLDFYFYNRDFTWQEEGIINQYKLTQNWNIFLISC